MSWILEYENYTMIFSFVVGLSLLLALLGLIIQTEKFYSTLYEEGSEDHMPAPELKLKYHDSKSVFHFIKTGQFKRAWSKFWICLFGNRNTKE